MRMKIFVYIILFLFALQGLCFAERQLNNEEIQQVLQSLTSHPKERWIEEGTIEARHDVFRAETGYVTSSTTTVRYDGDRFYWAININSHTKETTPNEKYKHLWNTIDIKGNAKRIFAWNGEQYTMYFKSGNNAIVEELGTTPDAVNGPLTAGIIPWGHGIYTYNNLLTKEVSAIEVDSNGSMQIHLTITGSNVPDMVFVLDPMRDHAVLSYAMSFGGLSCINKTYDNYEKVSGRWVPKAIMIERYDLTGQSPEVVSYDSWEITNINTQTPPPGSFEIGYGTGTLVEYKNPTFFSRPLVYRHTDRIDTDELLNEKMMIELSASKQHQNCAAKSAKYVMSQFGVDVDDPNLVALSNRSDRPTDLHQLRQFVRQYGLHSIAVKTDLETLETLVDRHVILHLPGQEHYVVLGYVDEKSVWVIDLDNNKFLYPISIQDFLLEWADGTALIISDSPLDMPRSMTEINDDRLSKLFGASGGFGFYSCTELIQEAEEVHCPDRVGELCWGRYTSYRELCGCESSVTIGSCYGTKMLGNISAYCIERPSDPLTCTLTLETFAEYVRACSSPCPD